MKEQERKVSTNFTDGHEGEKTGFRVNHPTKPLRVSAGTPEAGMTAESAMTKVWAWAHTEQGDLVCCLVFGIPLGVVMGWVTILVMSLDWWR